MKSRLLTALTVVLFLFPASLPVLSQSGSSGSGEWTWVSGSSTTGAQGVYGSLGVPSSSNTPGARYESARWIDLSGNLWLFGGSPSNTSASYLNDLWKFNPAGNTWTWISGSDMPGAVGSYGTVGVSSSSNVPSGRIGSVGWTDGNGKLWLFGGEDATGYLNDLWVFDSATTTWTWISGSNTGNPIGQYGTQGVPSSANTPGGRYDAVSWIDASGNLWLFGGYGAGGDTLNDLWKFNPADKTWTWVSGANTGLQAGVYGTQGVPAASNVPGARFEAISWLGQNGGLWLFGGWGPAFLDDLWEFTPANKTWTWISGSSSTTSATLGVYGTQGTPSTANLPGSRVSAVSWIDSNGNLWLFGGAGVGSVLQGGDLNDLWEFDPVHTTWNWVCCPQFLRIRPGTG